MNSIFNEDSIRKYLSVNDKRSIYVFESIDSTNSFAKQLASEGTPDKTLVVADTQTNGRGRLGRSFCSPSGGNIYMSVILRNLSIEDGQLITSCMAAATASAIDELCDTETKIKWVNDIFLNGRKICGILTEGSVDVKRGVLEYVVVGIGINLKSIKNTFTPELLDIATSIEDETGKLPDRCVLIARILRNIDLYIKNISNGNFIQEYRERSFIVGKRIAVLKHDEERMAYAVGIDDGAGLIVRYDDGTTDILNSGEARILKYGEK